MLDSFRVSSLHRSNPQLSPFKGILAPGQGTQDYKIDTFSPSTFPSSASYTALNRTHGLYSASHSNCQTLDAPATAVPGEAVQTTSAFTKKDYLSSPQGPGLSFLVDTRLQSISGQSIPNTLSTLPSKILTTEASLMGWSAHLNGMEVHSLWTEGVSLPHISLLELKVILLSLHLFLPYLWGHSVAVLSDNKTAISCINRQGGTISRSLCKLAIDL